MITKQLSLIVIEINPTEYPTFPERLNFAMNLREYSTQKLSNRIFLSHSTISGYRRGYRKPDINNLKRIAKELRVSTDFLLGVTNYIEKNPSNQ